LVDSLLGIFSQRYKHNFPYEIGGDACNTFRKHAGNMNLIISFLWWDSECAELEHVGTGTFRRLNHVHLKEQN